ncbi:MAG: DUF1849 family protein [Rhodospirillales bacterium]|nr:DUF1849 family protein [Rhodospirillales bacterium]
MRPPCRSDDSGNLWAWILRSAARLQGLAPCHCPLNTLSFRRPRVQIAAPLAAVCALLLLGLWIRVADAQQQLAQQQDVILAPHRATYDMKLSVARPNSGIIEVNGRMVLEMVDSCDAWEVKQRIKLKFLRSDGEEFDTDSSFTSYETKDGLQLRFSVRNIQDQEVEEELRGHADLEATGGKGRASFSLPEARSFDLPAGTLFPTTHLALIIRHARDGDKSVSYGVFDGARLDGAFTVNAVIGKPPRGAGAPVVRGDVGLLRQQSWGVRLAFFAAGDQGTANPEYELALDLLANGIARSMLLDYGDFAVDARLVQIQALPRPRC